MSVTSLIKRLEDIMRSDTGIDGTAQRLSQIVWLLFLMVFDYKEEEAELDDAYSPVIPEGFRWRDWARGKNLREQRTGDELLNFVNNSLIPGLKGEPIRGEDGKDYVAFPAEDERAMLVKEFMRRTHNYAQNGVQLRKVVNALNEVDFADPEETHEFNDIYESLLKDLQSAGRSGEFYTPRAITSFGVKHVNPKIGERVGDFSCGTGGFLVDALRHMEAQVRLGDTDALETIHKSLVGQEWKPMPYMLGVTNLMLHGVELPDITYGNSFSRKITSYEDADMVDVITMNPPYGGVALESDKQNVPTEFRSSETADLFMALIMERLKVNGRAVVVLPNGFLEGDDNVRIALKKKLLKDFNLHTVIRLPESVFAPYTSIETNLLFFDRTGSTQETWFYRFDKPEGYKHFSKTKPLLPQHLEVIDEWWDNRREIKDDEADTYKSQCLSVADIEERNYSLNVCDYPTEVVEVLPPDELIRDYKQQRRELDSLIDEQLAVITEMLGIEV